MKIKSLLPLLNHTKEGKNVAKNFGYLSLLQIAGYVFPLITMPYLARVIGTEGFGKIAFASSIMIWIQTIADWGFTFTATRDVAQHREDKHLVSQIFSNVFWARLLLTLFSGVILLIAVIVIPYLRENVIIILLTFLMVPGHVMFPEWFFQAIEKMKYTTIFNLISKLIFTIAVFILIHEKNDYIWQPLLTSLGYLVSGIGSLYLIITKWQYKLYKPNWKQIVLETKNSADVFINNLMPNLYNSFSVILLGFYGGAVANGLFDGGNRFPSIFYNLQNVLSKAFFPFLSRRTEKHTFFAKINIGSAILGSLSLVLLSPLIIKLMLGKDFEDSIFIMQILSVSIIPLALCNTYGTNFLIIHHHEKPLRNITFFSSFIGIITAIPLIYYFHAIGAACVILLCRTMLGVCSYMMARKYM